MSEPKKVMRRRLGNVLIFTLVLFFLIFLRLIHLQLIRGPELKQMAINQRTKGITIKPKRGIIYDRNGKKLAVSKNSTTVWVDPSLVNKEDVNELALKLSNILKLDRGSLVEKLSKESGHEKLKQWISDEEKKELKKLNIRALEFVDDYRRYYPYGQFAPHIIGFTSIDNEGLYGVEKTYDNVLLGKPGKWIKTTDDSGNQLPFDDERIYDASDGLSIVLTIDETIQKFAEKAVNKAMAEHGAKNISVTVMEPNTGDILAMVNKPDYDNNNPKAAPNESTKKRWEEMSEEEVLEEQYSIWRNYAINDIYEPGSTFKLITAAAALEENKVNPNTPFYCPGVYRGIKGEELRCSSYPSSHGALSFQRGLDKSCNIVFINTAQRLQADTFLKYIRAFGYGEKSGIDLNGEEFGLIPTDPESIRAIRLATMSYGHGIAATPLQVINSVSAIVNGGNLMKPRLVKQVVNSRGDVVQEIPPYVRRRVISEETSKTMLELMETVVSQGSGSRAYIPGYHVGGKTGTAEKVVGSRYVEGKYIGSFIGVAPTDKPRIVVLAIVDDPKGTYYGGVTAAPIAKEIIEDTLTYLEVDTKLDKEEIEKAKEIVKVPNLQGKTLGEAGKILTDLGLRHSIETGQINENSIVIEQSLKPNLNVHKGSVIDLKLKESESKESVGKKEAVKQKDKEVKKETSNIVPNLLGKDERQVQDTLDGLGIKYLIEGKGKVVEQDPKPSSVLKNGEKVKIKLK